ncbi:MAG: ParB N-terminal domain-containing protein [Prevotellaceae bacterium]|jgi:hypothetical protein|nr:ParB N-terminal domain-containing protein [Prevotellaceae bacterium]
MKIKFEIAQVVPLSLLVPNDYNPNKMPNKEMGLLAECIKTYGFLFPIVVNEENGKYTIIDGYHRYETLKRLRAKEASVVILHLSIAERMQLTVLMNRIKGMHQVEGMSHLVVKLSNAGLSDVEIAENLGMEAEEYIRLKQQLGIAYYYRDHEYSKSWEVTNE